MKETMDTNQHKKHHSHSHSHHHKHRHSRHRQRYSTERQTYNQSERTFMLLCMAGMVLFMLILIPLLANFMESA